MKVCPLCCLEAIAVDTKVVSTSCPHGPDEILIGELSGFLVPRRDPTALAQTINHALESELVLAEAEILTKVTAVEIAKQYLALIE